MRLIYRTITARDNYELTRNLPKCVGVERLCEGANIQIPFNTDEINLIYQFGGQGKAETCAVLIATTKRRKLTERGHSIKTRLAKAKAQAKQPTVADFPDIYKLTGQDEVSKTYSFPKSYVSYRKPRAVSTEQRERTRQMMIANNKAKGD